MLENNSSSNDSFYQARLNMVQNQLMPNQVTNKVLIEAISETPRHLFVDEKWSEVAYTDCTLPISDNRYILEPLLFAQMVEACKINPSCKVLDLGCGLGYSSIILARMAEQVIAIENDVELINKAKYLAKKLDANNCFFKASELFGYFAKDFFFDVIFVNGALHKAPENLLEQLENHGRMILVEPSEGVMKTVMYSKSGKNISKEELFVTEAKFLD